MSTCLATVNRYVNAVQTLTTSPTQTVRTFARELLRDMADAAVVETLEPIMNLPLGALTPMERLVRFQVGA